MSMKRAFAVVSVGAEVIIKGFLAKDGTPTVNASSFTLVAAKKEFVSDEAAPTP